MVYHSVLNLYTIWGYGFEPRLALVRFWSIGRNRETVFRMVAYFYISYNLFENVDIKTRMNWSSVTFTALSGRGGMCMMCKLTGWVDRFCFLEACVSVVLCFVNWCHFLTCTNSKGGIRNISQIAFLNFLKISKLLGLC